MAASTARDNKGTSAAPERRIGSEKRGREKRATAAADRDRRKAGSDDDSSNREEQGGGGGERGGYSSARRSGLDMLRNGFEDAAEGVKEALNKLANPLHVRSIYLR